VAHRPAGPEILAAAADGRRGCCAGGDGDDAQADTLGAVVKAEGRR